MKRSTADNSWKVGDMENGEDVVAALLEVSTNPANLQDRFELRKTLIHTLYGWADDKMYLHFEDDDAGNLFHNSK